MMNFLGPKVKTFVLKGPALVMALAAREKKLLSSCHVGSKLNFGIC